jgi:hypothetical protein
MANLKGLASIVSELLSWGAAVCRPPLHAPWDRRCMTRGDYGPRCPEGGPKPRSRRESGLITEWSNHT